MTIWQIQIEYNDEDGARDKIVEAGSLNEAKALVSSYLDEPDVIYITIQKTSD